MKTLASFLIFNDDYKNVFQVEFQDISIIQNATYQYDMFHAFDSEGFIHRS